jgi:hypothetical protein
VWQVPERPSIRWLHLWLVWLSLILFRIGLTMTPDPVASRVARDPDDVDLDEIEFRHAQVDGLHMTAVMKAAHADRGALIAEVRRYRAQRDAVAAALLSDCPTDACRALGLEQE